MKTIALLLFSSLACFGQLGDPAFVAALAPSAFSPANVPNLSLWITPASGQFTDAGTTPCSVGDLVYQWNDVSGNGNNVTQTTSANRPKSTSNGVCIPSGNSWWLNIPSGVSLNTRASTVFTVGRVQYSFEDGCIYQGGSLKPSLLALRISDRPSGIPQLGCYDGSAPTYPTPFLVPPATLTVQTLIGGAASATLAMNEDSRSMTVLAANSGSGGVIGSFNNGSRFHGIISEVLAYSRELTSTEIASVRNYLYAKYSITNTAAWTKTVVCDGDSLSTGYGLSDLNSYPVQMQMLSQTWRVLNSGVTGKYLSDMITTAAGTVDKVYDAGNSKNVVIIWGGTNDIINNGKTDTDIVTYLTTYCGARQAVGWKVIVLDMLPRNFNGTQETYRLNLNASLVSSHAFADGFVDVAGDSRLSDKNDTTYFQADKTHLTSAGYAVVASLVQAVLDSM